MKARLVTLVLNEYNEGSGVEGDPVSRVYALRAADGTLIAIVRPIDKVAYFVLTKALVDIQE